jgi:hypothetical protein
MRRISWKASASLVAALSLAGCGGGGGSSAPEDTAGEGEPRDVTDDVVEPGEAGEGGADAEEGGDAATEGGDVATGADWSTIPAEDRMAIAMRSTRLDPVWDVAWLTAQRFGVCGRDGVRLVDADTGQEVALGPLQAGCARLSAQGNLAVDRAGAVYRIDTTTAALTELYAPAEGEPQARAAAADGETLVIATETEGVLARQGDGAFESIGASDAAFDVVLVDVGEKRFALAATDSGVEATDLETAVTKTAALPTGAWRLAARDGGQGANDALWCVGSGGVSSVSLDADGGISVAEAGQVRGAAVDVAALGDCALAATWTALARYGCEGQAAVLEVQQLDSGARPYNPLDHVSSVATNGADRVVVGTSRGWALANVEAGIPDAPSLNLPDLTLLFAPTPDASPGVAGVVVNNDGSQPLLIESVTSSDPRFTVQIDPLFAGAVEAWNPRPVLVVEPYSSAGYFQVEFKPDGQGEVVADITIRSNDPDDSERVIRAIGNRRSPEANSAGPDIFLPDTQGKFWQLADFRDRVLYFKLFNST